MRTSEWGKPFGFALTMISLRKGDGTGLWQAETDLWSVGDNDYRCYELCLRYVTAKSLPQDEMLIHAQASVGEVNIILICIERCFTVGHRPTEKYILPIHQPWS